MKAPWRSKGATEKTVSRESSDSARRTVLEGTKQVTSGPKLTRSICEARSDEIESEGGRKPKKDFERDEYLLRESFSSCSSVSGYPVLELGDRTSYDSYFLPASPPFDAL